MGIRRRGPSPGPLTTDEIPPDPFRLHFPHLFYPVSRNRIQMPRRVAVARAFDRQLGYDLLLVAVPAVLLAGELVTMLAGFGVAREAGAIVATSLILDALFVHAPRLRTPRPTGRKLGDVPTSRLEKMRRADRAPARPLEAIRRDVSP